MLNAQCSMLNAKCSMLNAQCSMLNAQCSMLNARRLYHTLQDMSRPPCRTAHIPQHARECKHITRQRPARLTHLPGHVKHCKNMREHARTCENLHIPHKRAHVNRAHVSHLPVYTTKGIACQGVHRSNAMSSNIFSCKVLTCSGRVWYNERGVGVLKSFGRFHSGSMAASIPPL